MKILLNSGTPLKNQIAEQLRSEISSGKINAGQQLPSVRNLAKDLKISIITTVKAYELLEQDGSVTYIPEHGYIVTSRV